jgi:HEPN domain-containing protein
LAAKRAKDRIESWHSTWRRAQIRYWRDGSADDLEAARSLPSAGRLRQAGLFAHLAMEMAVKVCTVAATRDVAPRTHDLLLLIERAGISLNEAQREFMARVQIYCLEWRYPTESASSPPAQAVRYDIQQAQEMIQWLTHRLNKP